MGARPGSAPPPLAADTLAASHYQNDAGFFRLFLDPYMKYGSGYFEEGDTFERAAVRMLDRSFALARVEPGCAVLDVGSGWGAVARRLGETCPVIYHQVNPSSSQREYVARHVGAAARTFAATAEEAELPERAYDAIFAHDSFCHFRDKPRALARLASCLRGSPAGAGSGSEPTPRSASGGRMVIQDTFFLSQELHARHRRAKTTRFIQEEVFGFAEIVSLEAFVGMAAQAGLRIANLEDVSEHYRCTVAAWIGRLQALAPGAFPLRDTCVRYLRRGAACMGYTTAHHLIVLETCERSRARLRANVSALSGSRSRPGGAREPAPA